MIVAAEERGMVIELTKELARLAIVDSRKVGIPERLIREKTREETRAVIAPKIKAGIASLIVILHHRPATKFLLALSALSPLVPSKVTVKK